MVRGKYPVADFEILDTRADFDNFSGDLMAEN